MSILECELLQGYTQPEYLPGDFKPYVDYCRIKIKCLDKILDDKDIKIKFDIIHGPYTDSDDINTSKKIPLYYTLGTYETWKTGVYGGGDDYSIDRKNNPYKWKKCYINSDCYINLPKELLKDDIYIYLLGHFNEVEVTEHINIEVKSNSLPVLGTYGMNKIELEGNLCSLLYGNNQEKWSWTISEQDLYTVKFQNSDFTSVKNIVLNELDTLKSGACSHMFENNKYLKEIPECVRNIRFSKLNQKNVYEYMFRGCTSLEEITLNIEKDKYVSDIELFTCTFSDCTSLRNININLSGNTDDRTLLNLNGSVYDTYLVTVGGTYMGGIFFDNCSSVEKITCSMPKTPTDFGMKEGYGGWDFGHGWNNLFNLGNNIGSNIKNKYLVFPQFVPGKKAADNPEITDDYCGAHAISNLELFGSPGWTLGAPFNNMDDIGLGNGFSINIDLYIDGSRYGVQNIGRINSIPNDTTYSGLIKKINNLSSLSLGSVDAFVSDGYIIGSIGDSLYKLYNDDTKQYVKVTDSINKGNTYQSNANVKLYFKDSDL